MKPAETKRIYEAACRARRITPQDDEGRVWHRTLRDFETGDVEEALDGWWADTTPGHDGQPRGKWLPTPAELKPLVARVRQKREAAAREPQDILRWECVNHHRYAGFIARSKPTPPAWPCRGCGSLVTCIERRGA